MLSSNSSIFSTHFCVNISIENCELVWQVKGHAILSGQSKNISKKPLLVYFRRKNRVHPQKMNREILTGAKVVKQMFTGNEELCSGRHVWKIALTNIPNHNSYNKEERKAIFIKFI